MKTSLPISLLGVIVIQNSDRSVASVEDKSVNQVIAVRRGDEISSRAFVEMIEDRKVIFRNENTMRLEFVELPEDAPALKTRENDGRQVAPGIRQDRAGEFSVSREVVREYLGPKLGELLKQARCLQEMSNGKPIGFKCVEIEPGSLFDQLQFKNGDVVVAIDREPVLDLGSAMPKLQKLQADPSTSGVELTFLRDGKEVSTRIKFQ